MFTNPWYDSRLVFVVQGACSDCENTQPSKLYHSYLHQSMWTIENSLFWTLNSRIMSYGDTFHNGIVLLF